MHQHVNSNSPGVLGATGSHGHCTASPCQSCPLGADWHKPAGLGAWPSQSLALHSGGSPYALTEVCAQSWILARICCVLKVTHKPVCSTSAYDALLVTLTRLQPVFIRMVCLRALVFVRAGNGQPGQRLCHPDNDGNLQHDRYAGTMFDFLNLNACA